jgi:Zn-dependent protease with chaperone function
MFGNFIYIIVVLLIFLTYQPADDTVPDILETGLYFVILLGFFTTGSAIQFKRIGKQVAKVPYGRIDLKLSNATTRQSIMAVAMMAVYIYALNLPLVFAKIPGLDVFPTLQGLLCIALFLLHLAIVWYFAYDVHAMLHPGRVSRWSYVYSNMAFNIPVIFPWTVLSGVADIIQLLPFNALKDFLNTPLGEFIYFLVFLLAIMFFGPILIQKFWRCRSMEHGYTRMRIESICHRANLTVRDILDWPIFGGRMITAGVMGLFRKSRYILVTRSLLQFCSPDEVDAVIAHEIGHVKKYHLLFYLLIFCGYVILSIAGSDAMILLGIYSQPLFDAITHLGLSQETAASVFYTSAIIILFVLYFRYVFGYFMRNFERQADTYVYSLFNNAQPLISTLDKIAATSGQSPEKPNWHHFSIAQRVAYLNKCEADRSWVKKQDNKIKLSIAVYLAALIIISVVGHYWEQTPAGTKINHYLYEKLLLRELEQNPKQAEVLRLLGDLYTNKEQYGRAIEAYESSLAKNPTDTATLNNLAWLYATCEDPARQNPERALALAIEAAELNQAAHILDTLAESYFVNGKYREAVETAHKALAAAKENRKYFKEQLEKFFKILKENDGMNRISAGMPTHYEMVGWGAGLVVSIEKFI